MERDGYKAQVLVAKSRIRAHFVLFYSFHVIYLLIYILFVILGLFCFLCLCIFFSRFLIFPYVLVLDPLESSVYDAYLDLFPVQRSGSEPDVKRS